MWKPCKHQKNHCPWWTADESGYCEPCKNRGCHKSNIKDFMCIVRTSVVLQDRCQVVQSDKNGTFGIRL